MEHVDGQLEVFLQPGEYYFGDHETRVRTLLGSCISFTAWHPRLRIGAMCHYMLPRRKTPGGDLDGRYGEEAVLWFFREASRQSTNPRDYEIKIFGGGDMFERAMCGKKSVGRLNTLLGLKTFEAAGLRVIAQHVGGSGHRHIIFDIGTGDVWVRHVPLRKHETEKAIAA